MTPKSFSNSAFQEIRTLDREKNVNGVIREAAKHYARLGILKPEILETIGGYLTRCPRIISPQSLEALRGLPEKDLAGAHILSALNRLPTDPNTPEPGRISFPVVTSRGLVREIRLDDIRGTDLDPHRLALLDQVGSPVISFLRGRLNRTFLWHPDHYYFTILDVFENEDPEVAGESMGLPLALALYSHLTRIPVPSDLSATGKVMRDGSIRPVEGLAKKLAALGHERHFVTRLLISAHQKREDTVSRIRINRVETLEEAIERVFSRQTMPVSLTAEIDVDSDLGSIKKQYENYRIDTCIHNATALMGYLESRPDPVSKEKAISALFTCFWRRGSCYCHKGDIRRAKADLDASHRLFKRFPGLISANEYWDSRINFAVLLKDIFRYAEAEKLHHDIHREIQRIGGLDHQKGKNLSSLSQLCLARRRFSEAAQLQKKALRLIRSHDRHRNHGYLAQVYMRAGQLRKAGYHLARAMECLRHSNSENTSGHAFYDWVRSEYRYGFIQTLKVPGPNHIRQISGCLSKYPEITWYVPGLIHKFSGLAWIHLGHESRGRDHLRQAIRFFDAHRPIPC